MSSATLARMVAIVVGPPRPCPRRYSDAELVAFFMVRRCATTCAARDGVRRSGRGLLPSAPLPTWVAGGGLPAGFRVARPNEDPRRRGGGEVDAG